jgi:Protein of unknown function (DUF4233)
MRSLQRSMCAAMLTLQAVVLFLTTPVMISVSDVGVPTALAVGLGLTLACLVAAGTLRGPWGYRLGWAIQAASLVLGLVVPIMFVIGAIFAGLWVAAFVLGRRIDVEKAERAGLEEQGAAEHGGDHTAG